MPRELLRSLAADVDRLLASGATSAAGDQGLRRRAEALSVLGRQVPALAQVAEAAGRVLGSEPRAAARALLDLLLLVRQARAALATAGIEGDLEPVAPSGPWESLLPTAEVARVLEVLSSKGRGQQEAVRDLAAPTRLNDLRLVGPLLASLNTGVSEVADLVAERILPRFGAALLAELPRRVNLETGKARDGRWLAVRCRIDRDGGADLCRRALAQANETMAAYVLRCIPDVLPPDEAESTLLDLVRSKGTPPSLRAAAIQALGGLAGSAPEVLEILQGLLTDRDCAVQQGAIRALIRIGRPAVVVLGRALKSDETRIRQMACHALLEIGPEVEEVIPTLIAGLRSRPGALELLMPLAYRLGPPYEALAPTLRAVLFDPEGDWIGRAKAVQALAAITRDVAALVVILITVLDDRNFEVRHAALTELEKLGRHAAPARGRVVAVLDDRWIENRRLAAQILGRIGDPAAIPALQKALRDENQPVRDAAHEALVTLRETTRDRIDPPTDSR